MYAIHGQSIDFRDADLAITYAKQQPSMPGSVATELLGGASAPVCSRAHFDAHGPFDGPEQIIAGGLLHDTDTSGWRLWLSIAGGHDVTPPEGPIYEDFNLLRAAALAGQGTALCPLSVIADDLRHGRLCRLSHQTIYEDSAYYLVEPRESGRSRSAINAFKKWILTSTELAPSGAGNRKQ